MKGLEFLEGFGNPFEVNILNPNGSLGLELGVYCAPASFLVDRDGFIRYHHTGYISSEYVRHIFSEVDKWQYAS